MQNENKNTAEYTCLRKAESLWVFSDLHSAGWWDQQP